MRKNSVWHSIASSICAGVVTFFLLESVKEELFPFMREVVITVVGAVSFFIAHRTGKEKIKIPNNSSRQTEVGTSIESKEDVGISNIGINASSLEGLKVGSGIKSDKSVKISDIRINGK